MAEISQCPECGKQVRIPESLEGKPVRCPSCTATFTAGASSTAAPPPLASPDRRYDEPSPYEDDRDDDFERPRRRRRRYDDDDYLKPHRGGNILTLGIFSLICSMGILGPIFGIMAWTMGAGDLRQMREGRMDREGEGKTRGGMICGIIGTCLFVVAMCLAFMFGLLGEGLR